MIDLNYVAHQLRAAWTGVRHLEVRAPREIRVMVNKDEIPGIADYLRERFGARPELILAEDLSPTSGLFALRYVFELSGSDVFVVITTAVARSERSFPSLATRWYLASRFEREILDMFGLFVDGHPDLRRLTKHQFWPADYHPLLKDSARPAEFEDDGTPYPFRKVEGEGIFEITVGPVHAGIIEPGHFRFSVDGETIVNLESRLYFVHKGIEKLFETTPLERAVELAERISGDSSVAHSMAFCEAIESLAQVVIPERAGYLRVVLLELERLYNHIGDVGAICTDTGFAFANAHAMRLREDLLRLNARLVGHRLLRGAICIGGVSVEISAEQIADLRETVARVLLEFDQVVEIALGNTLLLDRLTGTGRLKTQTARELQVVGPAARASGLDSDVRRDHPNAAYSNLSLNVPVFDSGDVWARFMVRVEEAHEAFRLIAQALDKMPDGPSLKPIADLPDGACGFGLVEGWRGPVWHWITAGKSNSLDRVKIKDPSFANWPAVSYAILKNIVPDFPLVNKSFNLSYAGNDL
ncbi:MAG TPA: NADH-quinone oxidoreductase subunit C [Blastocatellia bacterium]|nr:NADH-quinone oxidoreductase subunit C [Blastocatellia bacterium]